MVSLITVADAAISVPGFSALASADQTQLVGAVTGALNNATMRVLPLTTHDERHKPENTRKLRLKQYPIAGPVQLFTGLTSVITIRNTDANATRAAAALTTTGLGDSLSVTGLTLTSTSSGVINAPIPLLFATYPTVASLAAQINTLPGWTATATPGQEKFATADINKDTGERGAIGTGAPFWGFTRQLNNFDVNEATGVIELREDFYQGFRTWDRVWGGSGQYGTIRAIYPAGYNGDPNAGPITVAEGLRRACFILIQAIVGKTQAGIVVEEQAGTDRLKYDSMANGSIVLVRDLISNYIRNRLV
jgi:hypothetical protein